MREDHCYRAQELREEGATIIFNVDNNDKVLLDGVKTCVDHLEMAHW